MHTHLNDMLIDGFGEDVAKDVAFSNDDKCMIPSLVNAKVKRFLGLDDPTPDESSKEPTEEPDAKG